MQKKQLIQFAVLLVLILALAGAYFGIRTYQNNEEEKQKQQEAAAEITLTAFQPDSVTAISYDYNGTQYTFEKDGETWTAAEQSEKKLDQDTVTQFLSSVGSITSNTEVEPEEGEDYGFDTPSRTVTITTDNGTSSLIFGMKNEMLSQYYLKTGESSNIYLVDESVYTTFEKTVEDFEQEEEETQTDTDSDTDTE